MTHFNRDEIAQACLAKGRTRRIGQVLDVESLRRFSVATGAWSDRPALDHWAWFLAAPEDHEIAPDGHPRRGDFLPALPSFERRMFASTFVSLEAPLVLGERADMTSTIVDVRHKAGRSGALVFVEVESAIEQQGVQRVVERQTLVYRTADGAAPMPLPSVDDEAHIAPPDGQVWTPGTVNLFRFSAVTFNGHRIHYDLPYARDVEGYPGLIVHGPFIAVRLANLAARKGKLASFRFRALAPCFVDQPLRLIPTGDGAFQALRCDGVVAATASASYC